MYNGGSARSARVRREDSQISVSRTLLQQSRMFAETRTTSPRTRLEKGFDEKWSECISSESLAHSTMSFSFGRFLRLTRLCIVVSILLLASSARRFVYSHRSRLRHSISWLVVVFVTWRNAALRQNETSFYQRRMPNVGLSSCNSLAPLKTNTNFSLTRFPQSALQSVESFSPLRTRDAPLKNTHCVQRSSFAASRRDVQIVEINLKLKAKTNYRIKFGRASCITLASSRAISRFAVFGNPLALNSHFCRQRLVSSCQVH